MIYRNNQELKARYYNSKTITTIYYGLKVVWTALTSCFSTLWSNKQKWSNNNRWIN